MGRLSTATNPESGETQFTYDGNNNVTQTVSPLPNESNPSDHLTITKAYDADNRILSKSYSDGFTPSVSYVYDVNQLNGLNFSNSVGRLVQVSADNGNSIIWNSYDQMGRINYQLTCPPDPQGGSYDIGTL
jgi:YD repeat-containing protein